MSDPVIGLGHNEPPIELKTGIELRRELETNHGGLMARTNEMIEMGRDFAADHPAIESDEVSGDAAGVIRQILAQAKSVDQVRVGVKDPYLQGQRIVDAFFTGEQVTPLQSVASDLNKMQTAFLRAKEDRRRREAAEAAEHARREEEARRREAERAERERRQAERAAAKPPPSAPLLDTAQDNTRPDPTAVAAAAQQRADEARAAQERARVEREIQEQIAEAPAPDLARTRGEFAMATLRTRWTYKIEDLSKVPLEFLQINDRMVKAAIAGPQGRRNIDGLLIYPEKTAQNR